MADIQELCDRVIIIDHGTIFFDGQLSEVVDRFADFKLITIQCEAGRRLVPAEHLAPVRRGGRADCRHASSSRSNATA